MPLGGMKRLPRVSDMGYRCKHCHDEFFTVGGTTWDTGPSLCQRCQTLKEAGALPPGWNDPVEHRFVQHRNKFDGKFRLIDLQTEKSWKIPDAISYLRGVRIVSIEELEQEYAEYCLVRCGWHSSEFKKEEVET